jgi:hypothetical protein
MNVANRDPVDRQHETYIRPLRSDVLVIGLAIASFALLGSLGGGLLRHLSTPSLWFSENIATVYWIRWCGAIVGRFVGDWICGVLLGRCLSRVSPWRVLMVLALLVSVLLIANGFFVHADSGRYLAQVGPFGVVFQVTVQIGAMFGIVALGIWYGRWWKQQLTRRSPS